MLTIDNASADIKFSIRAVLNSDEVILCKRTALYVEYGNLSCCRFCSVRTLVAYKRRTDHRTGGIRLLISGIVGDNSIFYRHRTLVHNDIVAYFTLNTVVCTLDSTGLISTAVCDSQRAEVKNCRSRSACATVKSVAFKINSDVLISSDSDVFVNITKKSYSFPFCSKSDCICKGLVIL